MTLQGSGAALLPNGNSGPRHERVGRVPLLRTQLQHSAGIGTKGQRALVTQLWKSHIESRSPSLGI
jgi:hypothetical protein